MISENYYLIGSKEGYNELRFESVKLKHSADASSQPVKICDKKGQPADTLKGYGGRKHLQLAPGTQRGQGT